MTQATRLPAPGQTVGPFFGFALPYPQGEQLVPPGRPDAVQLSGRVLDGAGDPVPDALLELWQADADGRIAREPGSLRRDGWTFTGWGRAATDAEGRYSFTTVTPGGVDSALPFFSITVFARGLLDRLFTRAYLPGAPVEHAAADPLLSQLSAVQRETLLARVAPHGYTFDLHLQGKAETVFLAHRQIS